MKWTNKGHELDELGEKITRFDKIAIFGAGVWAISLYESIKGQMEVIGFIDNDLDKQKNGYLGQPVFSPQEFVKNMQVDVMVVIAILSLEQSSEMIAQMENLGLKYNENLFYLKNHFAEIYMWFKKGQLISRGVSVSVTEKCTLNCKHCATFTPYLKKQRDIELSKLIKDVDLFFNAFDCTQGFGFFGGEPFLYPQLGDIIEYTAKNYSSRIIGNLSLATNCMVIPSEKTLRILEEYNVFINISDYSNSIPKLRTQIDKFIDCLKKNRIGYSFSSATEKWFDFGNGEARCNNISEKELIDWFDTCNSWCCIMKNKKFYICQIAEAALKVGFTEEDSGFDLENFNEKDKRILFEYNVGYSDKGYLDFCKKCNGYPPLNQKFVKSAVQAPRL